LNEQAINYVKEKVRRTVEDVRVPRISPRVYGALNPARIALD